MQTQILCDKNAPSKQPPISNVISPSSISPSFSLHQFELPFIQPSLPNPTQDPTNSPTLSLTLSERPSARPSSCIATANVCFAIDMSGSVCSPDFSISELCENCPAQCAQNPFNQGTCCGNFNEVKSFSVDFVEALARETLGSAEFSVVQFSTTATRVTGLSSSNVVIPFLNGLEYTGGFTNHAEALATCQQTLVSYVDPDRKNVILLITDGVATMPEVDPFGEAQSAAALVKNEGTYIRPVFIDGQNQQQLEYMSSLSSDGEVSEGNSFGELPALIQDLRKSRKR